ncbi:MAG: alpha/beta hydrolase [Parvibaculaceae bacterium]
MNQSTGRVLLLGHAVRLTPNGARGQFGLTVPFADVYLQGQDGDNPKASPLYAQFNGLPPIRIDVGDNEVLLSDSIRYTERAQAAGMEITLSIWEGMSHVFQSSLGQFLAAERSLNAIVDFLRQRLDALAGDTIPSNPFKGA